MLVCRRWHCISSPIDALFDDYSSWRTASTAMFCFRDYFLSLDLTENLYNAIREFQISRLYNFALNSGPPLDGGYLMLQQLIFDFLPTLFKFLKKSVCAANCKLDPSWAWVTKNWHSHLDLCRIRQNILNYINVTNLTMISFSKRPWKHAHTKARHHFCWLSSQSTTDFQQALFTRDLGCSGVLISKINSQPACNWKRLAPTRATRNT